MNKTLTKKEAIEIRAINDEPMMSSLRIAEITGKDHKHVNRDIKSIFLECKIDESKYGLTYSDKSNRDQKYYLLPEREFNLVVSGYSSEYRLKLIDELMSYREDIQVKAQEVLDNQSELFERFEMFMPKKDTYGELVEKTGLAKTKPVRGYFKSDRHDNLSKLIGERKRCENRLGGFFDDEIQIQIDALNVAIVEAQETIKIESKSRKIELKEQKRLKNVKGKK